MRVPGVSTLWHTIGQTLPAAGKKAQGARTKGQGTENLLPPRGGLLLLRGAAVFEIGAEGEERFDLAGGVAGFALGEAGRRARAYGVGKLHGEELLDRAPGGVPLFEAGESVVDFLVGEEASIGIE